MFSDNGIVLEVDQLPMPVTVKGKDGEQVSYVIMPAGRKFGASLQKIDERRMGAFKQ